MIGDWFTPWGITTAIAVVGCIVAIGTLWLKWTEHSAKRRAELYQPRLAVYRALEALFVAVLRNADVSMQEIADFVRGTDEAKFLFPRRIPRYLRKVYLQAIKLRHSSEQYRDFTQVQPPGYDHAKVVDANHAALTWLTQQGPIAERMFRPYLGVGR